MGGCTSAKTVNVEFDAFSHIIPLSFNPMEIRHKIDSVYECLRNIIDKTLTQIAHDCFQAFRTEQMTYKEVRVTFCSRYVINIHRMLMVFLEFKPDHAIQLFQLTNKLSLEVLDKLLKKYPVSKNNDKDQSIGSSIKSFNETEDVKCNMLRHPKLSFFKIQPGQGQPPLSRAQLFKMYRRLCNVLIEETREAFPKFNTTMKEVFGQKVDSLIGFKLSSRAQPYAKSQMDSEYFKFNSPEMFRVFIKWIESLSNNLDIEYVKKNRFPFVTLYRQLPFDGQERTQERMLNQGQKQAVISEIEQIKAFNQGEDAVLEQRRAMLLYTYVDKISRMQKTTDKQHFVNSQRELIESVQESLGSFCLDTLKRLFLNLNIMINNGWQDQVMKKVDFTNLNVFDLLRCKASGSKEDVIEVYERLKSRKDIQLVRVKNRLNDSTRDMLINFKIDGTMLICEMQLACKMHTSQKDISYYEATYNHFLYELKRSVFGPFTEAIMILYFQEQSRKAWSCRRNGIQYRDPDQLSVPQLQYKPNDGMSRQSREEMLCPKEHTMSDFFELPFFCTFCRQMRNIVKAEKLAYYCPECLISICNDCCRQYVKGYAQNVPL